MAKLSLSGVEFDLLCQHFRAPKEGKHIKWRDFCDSVDEVFTKKGLEKNIDMVLDDARTQTMYGRQGANKFERNVADDFIQRFKQLLLRQRLNAKSFF